MAKIDFGSNESYLDKNEWLVANHTQEKEKYHIDDKANASTWVYLARSSNVQT